MKQVTEFLSRVLYTIDDQEITVGRILAIPLILVVGFLLARLAEKTLSRRLSTGKVNPDVVHLLRRAFYVVVITALGFTALELLSVPLTAFAFISGAIAIGVGFGAQNIINNFISGWILMWERPVRIGDFLEIGSMLGTVEAINTRSTRVKRIDGVRMLIPNSHLLENTVTNWTLVDKILRSTVRVGVAYGSDVVKVRKLLEQVADENEHVLKEPEPVVVFEDFGDSSLVFDLYFWIQTTAERSLRGTRSQLRFAIDAIFKANDVTIAFPQRDVHIDGSIDVKQGSFDRP